MNQKGACRSICREDQIACSVANLIPHWGTNKRVFVIYKTLKN